MNNAEAIRALSDREEITSLIYRYCRAVDRIDEELGKSIFHGDATADYGDFFNGSGQGAIEAICDSHRALLGHSHQVTNILIDVNGDTAGSEAYHIATLRMMVEDKVTQVIVWGRYVDRWSRRDGRWGIDHRIVLRDLDEIREATPLSEGTTSMRDRSCPSYLVI